MQDPVGPKIRGVCQTRWTETGYQDVKYDYGGEKLGVTPRVRYIQDGWQPPCDEIGLDDGKSFGISAIS
jgi:hypothetical protein